MYLCGLLKILKRLTFKQTHGFVIDLGQTVAFWLYLIWPLGSRTSVEVKLVQDLVHEGGPGTNLPKVDEILNRSETYKPLFISTTSLRNLI